MLKDLPTQVSIPWDPTWKALDWAKEHCPAYITNFMYYTDTGEPMIKYCFSSDKEALWFRIMWS